MTSWELDVPLVDGKPPLNANQRLHHMRRHTLTADIRSVVAWKAKAAKVGRHEHITVQLEYRPGDNRTRDPSNLMPTMKAAVDGLRDAGVVEDDDPRYVTERMPIIHPGPGERRLWITVEVP